MNKLNDKKTSIGIFSVSANENFIEMIGFSGLDFVIIDCEHTEVSPYGEKLAHLIRAAETSGILPLVRITNLDKGQILKACNLGARGIIVPHVHSVEEISDIINSVKFPPIGDRSCAPPVRAAKHGFIEFDTFASNSNDNVMIIPLIEDPIALKALPDIVSVPGIDKVFFGNFDLSKRLSFSDSNKNIELNKALDFTIDVCQKADIPVMSLAWSIEQVRYQLDKGCQYVAFSTDTSIFLEALNNHVCKIKTLFL